MNLSTRLELHEDGDYVLFSEPHIMLSIKEVINECMLQN